MNGKSSARGSAAFCTALAVAGLGVAACSDDPAPVRNVRFAVTADAAFFRMRVFATAPTDLASAKSLLDSGCLQQQSRTYELIDVPVGEGYTLVYEGFPEFGCDPAAATSLGYRGAVSIPASGDTPYYHVQVYPKGDVATMPEEINLSASVARAVDFCDDAADCAASEVCYDAAKPDYWCVPSCSADADCRSIHVRASCDAEAGWCTLRSPFPLNMSEPRAFGAAATLGNGDVLLVGGMRQDGVGQLLPTMYPLERFDAATGLFAAATVSGSLPPLGGSFGFAQLAPDRFVTVGGFVRARVTSGDSGLDTTADNADVSADLVVWNTSDYTVNATTLPRSVARPTVVRLAADRFLVVGGLVVAGPELGPTRITTLCTVSDGTAVCDNGPQLVSPRQAPAAACLDAACDRLLVLGGNPGGDVAEILDLANGKADAVDIEGFGDKVFAPVLCGLDLVAGSGELARAAPFLPVRLTVDGDAVTATALAGAPRSVYLPAVSGLDVAFGATPECWLGGGLDIAGDAQATSARLSRASRGVQESIAPVLARPRFGAVAGRIGGGMLAGRVLFAGGVALDGTGSVKVVRGAEVLTP